ncbi:MAG TPA: ABC transporter substrate-binding protein [Bacilli bacterium]|nr:ABC transporter substrate-binding protein [Bacilli bacterium]
MKLSKKLIAVTAALTMTLGMVGCSKSGSNGDTIKIGANFEMTGDVAAFGNSQLQGIELAVEEINKDGGILGKKLEVIKADNASKADESTRMASKLITQDDVDVLLGATTSTNTLAAVPVAMDKKVPMLTASATNPAVTVNDKTGKVNDYIFRACFIDPFQGTVMAKFATDKLNAKTAVIYTDVASDYSKGLQKFFKQSFTEQGGEILAEESFQTKDTDFKAVLTRIKSLNPDVIYVPGYYQEVGKIVKQARELGITVPMMGGDGWDAPQLVEIAGADALNNTFISNHYSPEDPDAKVKNFVDAYKAKYNVVPDAMAVLGYDGMYMVADAIKRAGEVDHEKIKDALANTTAFEGVTGKIALDKEHNPVKAAVILEYKDGKQVFKDKIQP